MKKSLVLVLVVVFGWLSIASYQIYDVARQIRKLNVVDSLTVGESFATNLYPAITDITVPAANADTLVIIIRNPTTAANDTAEVALH